MHFHCVTLNKCFGYPIKLLHTLFIYIIYYYYYYINNIIITLLLLIYYILLFIFIIYIFGSEQLFLSACIFEYFLKRGYSP